jgi:tripartite-type tricarboxylate transporter receptor subunit TctC
MRGNRPWFTGLALATLLLAGADAFAQAWPSRPIHLVVPFAAGGRVDAIGRLICETLRKDLGQPCVVETRAGAGGAIGSTYVAKAAPDGYTLLMASAGIMAVLPNIDKKLSYDPQKDFTAISRVVEGFTFIGVNRDFAARSIGELIALAKQKPGTIGYATSGIGTYGHLAGELLSLSAGAPMVHVPYKGTGAAIADIRGGHVPVMIAGELGDIAKDGSVRILATTNESRSPDFPDVPTLKESGFPQFVAHSWIGLFGPAGLDPATTQRIGASVGQMLQDREVQDKLRTMGSLPSFAGGAAFSSQIGKDQGIYADIISKAGLKFE